MNSDDPMSVDLIFCRIGWMKRYQGITGDDKLSTSADFVKRNKFGFEILNFLPFGGRYYGYVQPPPGNCKDEYEKCRIDLGNFNCQRSNVIAHPIKVIWVATHPEGGTRIVGWYDNAVAFNSLQQLTPDSNRIIDGRIFGYYFTAKCTDSILLDPEERTFKLLETDGVPKFRYYWYANDSKKDYSEFRKNVLAYTSSKTGENNKSKSQSNRDPEKTAAVETAAIRSTVSHLIATGHTDIVSVEKDNVGWDLTARLDNQEFKFEVKGLSGKNLSIELTPNEYRAMTAHRENYHVCVVTSALENPKLEIFAYSTDSKRWESHLPSRRELVIEPIMSARCSAV